MAASKHPVAPESNVAKVGVYDPDKYIITDVNNTVATHEDLRPGCPVSLTQQSLGKYLKPITRELDEVAPCPTFDELPEAVVNRMLERDKAFWVDKPGANAYALTDAFNTYGMNTEITKPHHQDVFPRSYQYELECVGYRRLHQCDQKPNSKKAMPPVCRYCNRRNIPSRATRYEMDMEQGAELKRWRYYPDLQKKLPPNELRKAMNSVGKPFRHEACSWYSENYPSIKFEIINKRFAK